MNELTEKFPDLVVLGFPTNQFGHQTNEKDFEILNTLKYVRPGDGYEPKFPLFSKIEVNGDGAHPLFKYLRSELPNVMDDNGGRDAAFVISDPLKILWKPVSRSDIGWNFEKFLVNQDGRPVRRYSPKFATKNVAADIEALISGGPNALD
mmetsp:Transcript_713/g.1854  ORF Transcript_713/g.1854 Transcript_713/m.1854 type:complete len:150 (-) Transcript_713:208-657(-)